MSRMHLDHPTQATACGTRCSQVGIGAEAFDRVASLDRCRNCERVRAAQLAGRPHHSGLEPAGLEELDKPALGVTYRLTQAGKERYGIDGSLLCVEVGIVVSVFTRANDDRRWCIDHDCLAALGETR